LNKYNLLHISSSITSNIFQISILKIFSLF
jgi:hypothetical protein